MALYPAYGACGWCRSEGRMRSNDCVMSGRVIAHRRPSGRQIDDLCTTIHVDRRAGDERCGIAHQEIHHRSDLLRLARATQCAGSGTSFAACGTRAPIAVLIRPGAIAFTRMPCRPSRVPRLLVRLMTAALEAPYSTTVLPRWPATGAVLTIAPVSLAAINRFATYCGRRTARAH